MKLYEFAIIYVPKDDEDNIVKGKCEVLSAPQTILAASEAAVTLQAAKLIKEEYDLDFVQVLVRPF